MSSFLEKLNKEQYKAVTYIDGPSLVIAGAGSGKTRVLTSKIAYLLAQGVMPWNILALTFTNKAASEMKTRVADLISTPIASKVWMGTFHSIFSRILRLESKSIGYNSNFTIYDQSDSKSLIRHIVKELELDEATYKIALLENRISDAKNRLITSHDYLTDMQQKHSDMAANIPRMGEIYQTYERRCFQANAMDFDDLLLKTFYLFKDNPNICNTYAERFAHILVDEYQDTNYAQHCIIKLLSHPEKDLCVVGDDAQSIYSFRGANIENILSFTKTYPNAKLFKLEQNYRSTQTIVGAANSVIKHNKHQIAKNVFSNNEKGESIQIIEAYSDYEEAEIVIKEIEYNKSLRNMGYDKMAILYRTNAQSRLFEETCRKNSIPYKIVGGLSFYQRKEIKDIIAYFRATINPHDEEALRRIINYPARGIGNTTLKKLEDAATSKGTSFWNILKDIENSPIPGLQKATCSKLTKFRQLIENFQEMLPTEDAYILAHRIIRESNIYAEINKDNTPENLSKRENIMELLNAIQLFVDEQHEQEGKTFVSLNDYLSQASLMTDLTDQDNVHDSEEDGKITLMTVHSAKGLEFDCVFIVGLEQDLFPSQLATYSIREMEEERRLFYVAITRAKRFCYISYAQRRYKYGSLGFSNPSEFIQDIDPRFLQPLNNVSPYSENIYFSKMGAMPQNSYTTQPSYTKRTEDFFISKSTHQKNVSSTNKMNLRNDNETPYNENEALHNGQKVEHPRFGRGEIIQIEKAGDSFKLTITFEQSGTKKLLQKFAKLKIIE